MRACSTGSNIRATAVFTSMSNACLLIYAGSPRNVVDGQVIRASTPRSSRTSLKRPIPSFTIEVRRRPGRAANPGANPALFETKPPRGEFDRDTQRAVAAIFGPKSAEVASAAVSPSPSKGRILASLVSERPLENGPEADLSLALETPRESPSAEGRRRLREVGAPLRRSRNRPTSTTDDRPHAPSQSPVATIEHFIQGQSEDVAPSSTRQRLSPATRSGENASPKARPSPMGKTKSKQIVLTGKPPKVLSNGRASIPDVVVSQAPPAEGIGASVGPRKRTILGRYVYGDEPKFGQRWKLRLRKTR